MLPSIHKFLLGAAIAIVPLALHAASSKGVTLDAYDFGGGNDGANPAAGLLETSSSTRIGTTLYGGRGECGESGCGTVYQISSAGKETVLYSFQGGSDGAVPSSELYADSHGNVYGTTEYGGGTGCDGSGCGTIFILFTGGRAHIVPFAGGKDGAYPMAGMVAPPNSNYAYGTTSEGGGTGCISGGCGTVFEVSQTGVETVIYAFKGGKDGSDPIAQLIADKKGNLYGTTVSGGGTGCSVGCGTVFEITPSGKERVLYAFKGGSDGAGPEGRLFLSSNGVVGTTAGGGGTGCGGQGCGTVFVLDNKGKKSLIYSFVGGSDGSNPAAGLLPCAGNCKYAFGTTEFGGGTGCGGSTIYEIDASGKEKILYSFTDGDDGGFPVSDLVGSGKGGKAGKHGYLYGTAYEGGTDDCNLTGGCGSVFTLKY